MSQKIIWSKSRFKLFANCPKAYDYSYIQKIPQATPESLTKGVKLNDIFDKFYKYRNINLAMKELNIDNDFIAKYDNHINNFMDFVKKYKRAGNSWGCAAIPQELIKPVVNTIKNGSLVFAYYPSKQYLSSSQYLV